MVATALDVVSLDEMKSELRISTDELSQDGLLTGHIQSAVSFVSSHISLPLVDQTIRIFSYRPSLNDPAVLGARAVKSVSTVKYWGAWFGLA